MFEPLYIRPEVQHTHRVFFDWLTVSNNKSAAARIQPVCEQTFLDWEQHCSANALDAITASLQRWIQLLEYLKTRELHSPQNLELAISRMPRYMMLARSQRNYWVPLLFQPPILLHPILRKNDTFSKYNMIFEEQKWERLRQNHGYFNYRARESGEKIVNDLRLWIIIKSLQMLKGPASRRLGGK